MIFLLTFTQKIYIMILHKRKKGEIIMFNEKKFREAVKKKGLSMGDIAEFLNINPSTLYRKMSGESDFYRGEIQRLCELLELKNPSEIFFA